MKTGWDAFADAVKKMVDRESKAELDAFDGLDSKSKQLFLMWVERARKAEASLGPAQPTREPGFVKPDNDRQVFFYEQDFYVLSNFSAFNLEWEGKTFPTSEHAYHYSRFPVHGGWMYRDEILRARSAHDAFRYAQENRRWQRDDWDDIKVGIMRDILRAKANQHEYVRRKLLASGDRELIEDSWRDAYWGWGPNRDGQNMLGKLWMEVRAELRASSVSSTDRGGQ